MFSWADLRPRWIAVTDTIGSPSVPGSGRAPWRGAAGMRRATLMPGRGRRPVAR